MFFSTPAKHRTDLPVQIKRHSLDISCDSKFIQSLPHTDLIGTFATAAGQHQTHTGSAMFLHGHPFFISVSYTHCSNR